MLRMVVPLMIVLSSAINFSLISAEAGVFSFAFPYDDYMVLQKAPKQAVIWGYSDGTSDIVGILLDGQKVSTAIVRPSSFGHGSVWTGLLPPVDDTHEHTITVASIEGKLRLQHVLFGDVWLCSGQSNMEFTLGKVFNATQEIEEASRYPNIRLFTVGRFDPVNPQYDLKKVEETWSLPNKTSVGSKDYFSAVCWLYGKYLYDNLKYPIGLISSTVGGTKVEQWSSPDSLEKCNIENRTRQKSNVAQGDVRKTIGTDPSVNSKLYNGMIHPLLNVTLYGVIWYQGESNTGSDRDVYNCTFPAMIDDWRSKFFNGTGGQSDPYFPFGFVQLAAWRNGSEGRLSEGFPDIRWHQTADYGYVPNARLKNVFMSVAMDLPDFQSPYGSIHPRDKQDVAERLAAASLAVAYQQKSVLFSGPIPNQIKKDVGRRAIHITFNDDIDVRNKSGFEICCSPVRDTACNKLSEWKAVTVHTFTVDTVVLSYAGVCTLEIVKVRYAWMESPCAFKRCPVYGLFSTLPAPPFEKPLPSF